LNYFPDLTNQLKLELLSKFKLITYAIFGIYYLVVLVQISLQRRYSAESLGLDIGWMSSTLLILATPWLMPWYASILLPVTALNIEDRRFVFTSLAFCLSSTGYYVLISTGVLQSWFVVGLPFLVLGVEMIMPRSKKYVT
jgi:alpha-1,6-mannosyltransferase